MHNCSIVKLMDYNNCLHSTSINIVYLNRNDPNERQIEGKSLISTPLSKRSKRE